MASAHAHACSASRFRASVFAGKSTFPLQTILQGATPRFQTLHGLVLSNRNLAFRRTLRFHSIAPSVTLEAFIVHGSAIRVSRG